MRTAAAQLEFTAHLPRLDAEPFACAVWTPAHEPKNTGAPVPAGGRKRPAKRAGKCLITARWTRLCCPTCPRLRRGARGFTPHTEPQHWGAAIAGATVFDLLAISARLPPASLRPPGGGAS